MEDSLLDYWGFFWPWFPDDVSQWLWWTCDFSGSAKFDRDIRGSISQTGLPGHQRSPLNVNTEQFSI